MFSGKQSQSEHLKQKQILEVKQVFMRDQEKGWKQMRHQTN